MAPKAAGSGLYTDNIDGPLSKYFDHQMAADLAEIGLKDFVHT
jgi:hypothetical protein